MEGFLSAAVPTAFVLGSALCFTDLPSIRAPAPGNTFALGDSASGVGVGSTAVLVDATAVAMDSEDNPTRMPAINTTTVGSDLLQLRPPRPHSN